MGLHHCYEKQSETISAELHEAMLIKNELSLALFKSDANLMSILRVALFVSAQSSGNPLGTKK